MYLFTDIISRLKTKLNLSSDKDLYDLMGATQGTFSNWKNRNSIPYEKITTLCIEKNLDLIYILSGNNKEEKTQIEIDYDLEIKNLIKSLNKKQKERYFYLIKAEILKD